MKIHTATVTLGTLTVPLTKSIVRQLEWIGTYLKAGWKRSDLRGIGVVLLDDETAYLIETPDGLQRAPSQLAGITNDTRIILTK